MVVRLEAVRRRLARLEEILSTLARLDYDPTDPARALPVACSLQFAVEVLFDVGNHLLSASTYRSRAGSESTISEAYGSKPWSLFEIPVLCREQTTFSAGWWPDWRRDGRKS